MTLNKLLCSAAWAALTVAAPALAEEQDRGTATAPVNDESLRAPEIIVNGAISFRDRTEDPNPVLSYDLEYFQKFEPVSVGEMLKRVPGVTFTSDVLEYDAPQFRGLPAGYTQILINGRRAPGAQADRSFFVDRIPAELVERIEIIRAPRADQPSEGVAGTLNVVTKESATFEGGFVKAGALINGGDGEIRPSVAAAYAGKLGEDTTFWGAVNYQERRNPKKKVSYRFDDVPTTSDKRFPDGLNSPYVTDPEFNNFEAQNDTRDGSDLSANAEITTRFGEDGHFRIGGFFVDTNRTEYEESRTYDGAALDYVELATQLEDINQQTYAVTADAKIPLGGFELGIAGAWNGYREKTVATEIAEEFGNPIETDVSTIDIKDDEYTGTLYGAFGDEETGVRVKVGIDWFKKNRDGLNDGDFISESFRIKEDRYDPYARVTLKSEVVSLDAGLRYQITKRDVIDAATTTSYEDQTLNPSLHLRFTPSAVDQIRVSFARTVRRPGYDLVSPLTRPETPNDDDTTRGNPELRNEKAWGLDVGYERRLGAKGIVGVNVFYRDISDLIELVSLGNNDPATQGQDFVPANIGNGKTWGVEVDFSTPLNVFGFGETGLFANYTYMDSETTDPFTREKRQFNDQPHHLYNVGFIQNVDPAGVSFGATISGRSKSFASNYNETVELSYDPDLEAFVEKRFGRHFVLRFSAQNLLDRVKKEDFRKYDGDSVAEILRNRAAGDIDEYEIERERAGPLFQVTVRAAF